MKKIVLVFGTRPEAIKMAPLVHEFKKHTDSFETYICVTAQHRHMLDQVLSLFQITPDFDLDIMKENQDLYDLTARILLGMRDILSDLQPDLVLVHGDTTTSTATALAAFYQKIPVAHVEAGLRTGNIYSPWPEEMNRSITGRIASYHFAPTTLSKENLLKECVAEQQILVTGNTVIDALYYIAAKIETDASLEGEIDKKILDFGYDVSRLSNNRRLVLITGHRRENFGDGFLQICTAIKNSALKFPTVDFVYPVHLNPQVQKPVNEILGSVKQNVFLIPPLEYLPFVCMMKKAYLILTDSGGVQEEAPGLGKPVLVMRETTERPEAVEAGTVKLVGANQMQIEDALADLLNDSVLYTRMSQAKNPYGDGFSSKRIVEFLKQNI